MIIFTNLKIYTFVLLQNLTTDTKKLYVYIFVKPIIIINIIFSKSKIVIFFYSVSVLNNNNNNNCILK